VPDVGKIMGSSKAPKIGKGVGKGGACCLTQESKSTNRVPGIGGGIGKQNNTGQGVSKKWGKRRYGRMVRDHFLRENEKEGDATTPLVKVGDLVHRRFSSQTLVLGRGRVQEQQLLGQ